jgi:adenine C2-methylase RlmN of 23S rRNA A2503 and tRNA A37
MMSQIERYFPETLVQVYFNYCVANDVKPSFEDMLGFISEIQGDHHVNGIHITKVSEVINGFTKRQSSN